MFENMISTQRSLKVFLLSVSTCFLFLALNIMYVDSIPAIIQSILPYAVAQPSENLTLFTLIGQGSPYQGNLNASIVIIDFSDFQCYLCKRHVDNTEQQIKSTYVQPGKAIYVFKHLPNRGFDSKNASIAAQCTNDQGKFWEFHKTLYANQGPIDSGWVSTQNLKKFAMDTPGMNFTQFDSCFDTKKYESFVDKDIALANSLGFTETPSFIIMNNKGSIIEKIQGPKPFPIFKSMIDNLESKMSKN
jgi:protein-disulfide isomerase